MSEQTDPMWQWLRSNGTEPLVIDYYEVYYATERKRQEFVRVDEEALKLLRQFGGTLYDENHQDALNKFNGLQERSRQLTNEIIIGMEALERIEAMARRRGLIP